MSARTAPLGGSTTISRTLLLNMGLIGMIGVGILFLLLAGTIYRSFGRLEDQQIRDHIARVADFQNSNLDTIAAKSKDWGIWDDTYYFVQDFNAAYIAKNINSESFRNAVVDGLAILRTKDGAGRGYYFDHYSGETNPAMATPLLALAQSKNFVERMARNRSIQTFAVLNGRLYMMGAVQIRKSDGTGISPGFLVFIEEVNNQQLTDALQVDGKIDLAARPAGEVILKTADHVLVQTPIKGLDGKVIGAVSLQLRRPLVGAGKELLAVTFAGVSAAMIAMLALLNQTIRSIVLKPIERLHTQVSHIRSTGELLPITGGTRADELGALQEEFNSMTEELRDLRSQIESQSFLLGKSQSAVGLMHNLRNCLSPVRVILETLERDSEAPLPHQTPRALEELASETTDASRREKLAAFLAAVHDQIGAKTALHRQQVREAGRNLMNALSAIDTAQQDRGDIRFDERCDVSPLLSHAANIIRFTENMSIGVDIEVEPLVMAQGNRVLLSQVIENLVVNAVEAIRAGGRSDGAILLRAGKDDASGTCRITVTDNGGGFDAEVGRHLFERGFSTRESKSGGLGLHWCANTIKAMSGSLSIESAGEGLGASVEVVLPCWQDTPLGLRAAS